MKQNELDKIRKNLAIHLEEYINAIIEKYGKYIPKDRLEVLNNISDYESLINIHDYGSVNAYATNHGIAMPLCADKLLNIASKVPGYGINKNHHSYNSSNLINNNNTFMVYIIHVFVSGTNAEGYYEDMLLHEVVHFCGSGGASALREGINELLTRKIALDKGFRTNGCGYPKEVHLAYRLQSIFGEDIIDQIAFIESDNDVCIFLADNLGEEAASLYLNVVKATQKEFDRKYYEKMDSYSGAFAILKKTLNYNFIDYSRVYQLLDDYELSRNEKEEKRMKR